MTHWLRFSHAGREGFGTVSDGQPCELIGHTDDSSTFQADQGRSLDDYGNRAVFRDDGPDPYVDG